MSSLRHCLEKMGLAKHEAAILRGKVDALRGDGYEAHKAAEMAVLEYIDNLESERADILKQVKDQGDAQAAADKVVPDAVRRRVEIALGKLQEVARRMENVERARGRGHTFATEWQDQQPVVEKARATMAEFRRLADEKGIDAESVIKDFGGEPDLTKFDTTPPKEQATGVETKPPSSETKAPAAETKPPASEPPRAESAPAERAPETKPAAGGERLSPADGGRSIDDQTAAGVEHAEATPRTLSAEEQDAAVEVVQGKFRERFGKPDYLLRVVRGAADPSDGKIGGAARARRAAAEVAQRIFGVQIIWVEQPKGRIFNGVHSSGLPGVVFMDVTTSKPALAMVGHELLHEMRRVRPDLYADIETALRGYLRDTGKHGETLNKKIRDLGGKALDADVLREELIADIFGDRFVEREFWDGLARKQPSRFRQIADAVLRFLNALLGRVARVNPFGTDSYISDLKRVRDIVTDTVLQYSAGEVVGVKGDVNLSASGPGPIWYSALQRAVVGLNAKAMQATDWVREITATTKRGVKHDEIEWSGIGDWLQMQSGKVTKDQVLDYLRENGVRVEETVLGGAASDAYNAAAGEAARLSEKQAALWREIEKNIQPISGVDRANLPWWGFEMVEAAASPKSRAVAEKKARDVGLNDEQIEALKEYGQAREAYVAAEERAKALKSDQREAKYESYTLPGGKNYRELLLTLPEGTPSSQGLAARMAIFDKYLPQIEEARAEVDKATRSVDVQALDKALAKQRDLERARDTEADSAYKLPADHPKFRSGHFDQPNILAHVRFDERTDAEGKRVLFIEEIQSDWQQSNRRTIDALSKPQSIRELADDVVGSQLAAVMPLNQVDGGMLSAMQNEQVIRAVVASLPVKVVHDFLKSKEAAEQFLSNSDVLKSRLPEDHLRPVADALLSAMRSVGADLRAKLLAARNAGRDEQLLPALKASDLDTRVVLGLLAPERIYHPGLSVGTGRGDATRGGTENLRAPSDAARGAEDGTTALGARGGQADAGSVTGQGAETSRGGVAGLDAKGGATSFAGFVDWHRKIAGQQGGWHYTPGPFVGKTEAFVALALKRMIRFAAEHGFDRVAFTTGEQQADRYNLVKSVDKIEAVGRTDARTGEVSKSVFVSLKGGSVIVFGVDNKGIIDNVSRAQGFGEAKGKPLADVVGKELADRIMRGDGPVFQGDGLKLGGEGMRAYYDKIVPNVANDVLKKLGGGRVRNDISIEHAGGQSGTGWRVYRPDGTMVANQSTRANAERYMKEGYRLESPVVAQPGFDITDAMRERVLGGVEMFGLADEPQQAQDRVRGGYASRARRVLRWLDTKLDPLSSLPNYKAYLKRRYDALGEIGASQGVARAIHKAFKGATEGDKQAAYAYLTTAGATPDQISAGLRPTVVDIKRRIGEIGDKLVARGLISEEAREDYRDRYLPRLYLKHLLSEEDYRAIGTGKRLSDMGYLKERKDVPEDVRRVLLGEIKDPAFLSAMAISRTGRDFALMDFLIDIARANDVWALNEQFAEWNGRKVTPQWLHAEATWLRRRADYPTAEDAKKAREIADQMDAAAVKAITALESAHDLDKYRRVPDTPKYGQLRGMLVRKEIYDDIVGVYSIKPEDMTLTESLFGYGGIGTKINQMFKTAKVALNPPAQFRNWISNAVMLQLSGVALHRLPMRIAQAIKEMRTDGAYWKIAKQYGVTEATFTSTELFRIEEELLKFLKESGQVSPFKKLMVMAQLFSAPLVNKAGDLYQAAEAVFKTAKIIDAMEHDKMSAADAAMEGHKWMFDYSLVPQEVRYARNAPIGAPFMTYFYKAAPRLLEVAMLHPQRLIPWVGLMAALPYLAMSALGVDEDELERFKKALPEWMRQKPHLMVLPWRDSAGRVQVADLGYFFPWTLFTETAYNAARGDVKGMMGAPGQLLLSGPIPQLMTALGTGVDPFTDREIANKGDPPLAQAASWLNFLYNMAAPPIVTSSGLISPMGLFDERNAGKLYQGMTGTTNKFGDERTTTGQAVASAFGALAYGVDPKNSQAQQLLRMVGEIRDVQQRVKQRLEDRSLTEEQKRKIIEEYKAEMKRRYEKLAEFQRETSPVPAKLQREKVGVE